VSLIVSGTAIAIVGIVVFNVVFFRFIISNQPGGSPSRAAATFQAMFWMLIFGAVFAGGLSLALLGFSLEGSISAWAPSGPLALVVLIIPTAWFTRWRLSKLRG
jgi:hypothetical protein